MSLLNSVMLVWLIAPHLISPNHTSCLHVSIIMHFRNCPDDASYIQQGRVQAWTVEGGAGQGEAGGWMYS